MNRRSFLRSGLVVGAAAASGCATRLNPFAETSTPELTPTPEPPETRAGTALTGLYPGGPNAENAIANLDLYTEWLSRPPAVALVFVDALVPDDAKRGFVEGPLTDIWKAGHVPLVTWQPFAREKQDTSETVERAIAAGEYDDDLASWASLLESWTQPYGGRTRGRRFYFRPAHEMNGNWFPWSAVDSSRIDATVTSGSNATSVGSSNGSSGDRDRAAGTPQEYVKMWRRLYDAFDETALDASDVQWIWAVNADEIGGLRMETYYPGDRYVDWVGLDGFNFGASQHQRQWTSKWRTPAALFDPMVKRLRELTDKPVALTEFASTAIVDGEDGSEPRPERKAEWIENTFAYVADNDIKLTCWFNVDKTGADEADWAVFGGERGTSRVTVSGERYPVYDTYERTVTDEGFLGARTDYPPLLTDDEFAGAF